MQIFYRMSIMHFMLSLKRNYKYIPCGDKIIAHNTKGNILVYEEFTLKRKENININSSYLSIYVFNGEIFIHDNLNSLFILRKNNSIERHTVNNIRGQIVVKDNIIYFKNKSLYAYDINLRKILWESTIVEDSIFKDRSFLVVDDDLYLYDALNHHLVIDAKYGSMSDIDIFTSKEKSINESGAVLVGKDIIFNKQNGEVVCYGKWKKKNIYSIYMPLKINDNHIFCISNDSCIVLDINSGDIIYNIRTNIKNPSKPIVVNGSVYFSSGRNIYEYSNGIIRSTRLKVTQPFSLHVYNNDILIISSTSISIYESNPRRTSK